MLPRPPPGGFPTPPDPEYQTHIPSGTPRERDRQEINVARGKSRPQRYLSDPCRGPGVLYIPGTAWPNSVVRPMIEVRDVRGSERLFLRAGEPLQARIGGTHTSSIRSAGAVSEQALTVHRHR